MTINMIPGHHGAIIINPTPQVTVVKRKNNKPTVILYDGLRFIQEQQARGRKVKPGEQVPKKSTKPV